MVIWNWDEMFGNQFYVEIKNEERKYFGLEEIASNWEKLVYFSKTNLWYKHTTVYLCNDKIVKVIHEEKRVIDNSTINYESYYEYDTALMTEEKQWILPLTNRGKKKKISPTNLQNITPFGCAFFFCIDSSYNKPKPRISVCKPRSNQILAIGERDKIREIRNSEDFRTFLEYYISTCPPNYMDRILKMKNSDHITVKYKVGDIFRIEYDRFNYCYGIIVGEVKKIRKWKELPQEHSLCSLMLVPVLVRLYQIVIPNGNMTAEELKNISLGRLEICGDNDIIWGTYPIVSHKKIEETDLEFNLVCTKYFSKSPHNTIFTQDFFSGDERFKFPEEYIVRVEWGTAVTEIHSKDLSEKLKQFLKNYSSPHGGVAMGIDPEAAVNSEIYKNKYSYKNNLLTEDNRDIRNEIFINLGLSTNASFDEFAEKFGGMTLKEILKKYSKN